MQAVARELRRNPTSAEDKLWQAIRKQRLNGRKYRRQVAIGAFVVDFYCASERLAIEVDGPIHEEQQEADRIRQELIESLDIRFVRLTNAEVEHHLEDALNKIRSAFSPHPDPHPKSLPQNEGGTSVASSKLAQPSSPSLLVGEGAGGWGVEWPPVDVIVGNPPFLGDKKMRGEQGDDYVDRLREYYKDRLPGGTDFVTYWFEIARKQVADGQAKRVGLLATNSIRGGANREVLKRIAETGSIFMAWSDREWILDGAAVRVSMVGFDNGIEKHKALNGLSVSSINSDLTSSADITTSQPLRTNGNLAFIGSQKGGAFDIEAQFAKSLLDDRNESGVHNFDVVRPWMNGSDIVRMPRNMWIINFHTMSHEHASNYTAPMNYVEAFVKPKRLQNTDKSSKKYWWLHQRPRPEMRDAMADAGIVRFICTPRVAKHRVFVWLHIDVLPDSATVAIARDDNYFFGVLHSKLHEVWSLRMGTSLEDRPRYTPTTTFETFPFPWSPGREDTTHPAHAAISAAAANLHEERDAWLNPHPPVPSPIMREGELDTRELSTSDESPSLFMGEGFRVGEKALKDRTLTNLYNALSVFRGKDTMKTKAAAADFAPRLDQLHTALDQAVCDAYGWEVAILEDEEEILRRLLALNLERAEAS